MRLRLVETLSRTVTEQNLYVVRSELTITLAQVAAADPSTKVREAADQAFQEMMASGILLGCAISPHGCGPDLDTDPPEPGNGGARQKMVSAFSTTDKIAFGVGAVALIGAISAFAILSKKR